MRGTCRNAVTGKMVCGRAAGPPSALAWRHKRILDYVKQRSPPSAPTLRARARHGAFNYVHEH